MGKRDNRDIAAGRFRQRTLIGIVALFFAILVARLFTLQGIRHDEYSRFAKDNQLQRERIPSPRGYIKDRTGKILVDNVLRFEIVMLWTDEREVEETVSRLAEFLPIDSTRTLERFQTWVEKKGHIVFPIIPEADKLMISFVRENADIFPHLRVRSRARRRYRQGSMAAHVLGYVGEVSDQDIEKQTDRPYYSGDMVGKIGLELYCEDKLRGYDGQRALEVNASGTILGELKDLSIPPQPGKAVTLTIDAHMQELLERLISQAGVGAAVAMSVDDGAIIAAASVPQFDPNRFATGITQKELNDLFENKKKPLFNRIHQAQYPPASTLKIVSAFCLLDNGLVDPNQVLVYCTGAHKFGNRVYRCWDPAGHGAVNLHKGIVQSCDVYFYKAAEIVNVDDLSRASNLFGLGEKTGIELPGEVSGLVPSRDYYDRRFGKGKWTQGYILNNIIGQGEYLATILQIARVAAAVANGGYLVRPHLIDQVEGEPEVAHRKTKVNRLTGRALRILRETMRDVVRNKDGTAHWTSISGFSSAGKTGTAQNPHGENHALYMAYAPADSPEIAFAVIIENAGHGGEFAAPIARDFFKEYFGVGKPPETVPAVTEVEQRVLQSTGDASQGDAR